MALPAVPPPPRWAALVGLGFGDCGKGLFTDALCRRWPVHSVVRFNGGGQAGHNVVLPDGRHHTFSQFAAGSFVPGVATVLAAPVVLHPTALHVEEAALQRVGVRDAWSRLWVDARCLVTTPFHQAAGRLREWQRGAAAHGSCGTGFGETVRQALEGPAPALRYGDLLEPQRALPKLAALREHLATQFERAEAAPHPAWAQEASLLRDEHCAARWLAEAREVARRAPPRAPEAIAEKLRAPGSVLFEGAQGMLLDEWHGFHPHTTWSSIGPGGAESVLADLGLADAREPVQRLGVLRSYPTRHGAGPLPTHDLALDNALAEPHNGADGWQGAFRRGHPDGLLLRYAAEAAGGLDGLLLSHADALTRAPLRWCEAYDTSPNTEGDDALCTRTNARVTRLHTSPTRDLTRQQALTALLNRARPVFEPGQPLTLPALLERIETAAGCTVHWQSAGPTTDHVVAAQR